MHRPSVAALALADGLGPCCQHKMRPLEVGAGELMLRAIIVYFFIYALLRLIGKTHVGEMAPFDLVVLLILSEAVQNAIVGDDKSVTGGLVAAATLVGASALVGYATWRNKREAQFFEGRPRILVRHGHVCKGEGPSASDAPSTERPQSRRFGPRADHLCGTARGAAPGGLYVGDKSALRGSRERW
jgi:hypothetical protein